MATEPEIRVRKLLEDGLGVQFQCDRRCVDDWGQADGWAMLTNETWLVVEVEAKQKHPTTNVLKYWPYLENHRNERIVLAHCFFPDSPGLSSSRGKLARWLGSRLELLLEGRFFYQPIVVPTLGEPVEGFDDLERRVLTERRKETV